MQKKIIALAVAGLMSGAAFAQSNVTIYGAVRVSIDSINANVANADRWAVSDRVSRIGFKGSEDLGGGMKAIWQWESQMNTVDSATVGTAQRNTFVGLSGGFGTVLAGTHDTPYKLGGSADLFGDTAADAQCSGVGGVTCIIGRNVNDNRATSAVAYISPTWSGFHFAVAGVAGEQTALQANGARANGLTDALSMVGVYENGPLKATLGHEVFDKALSGAVASVNDKKATKFNIAYKMGAVGLGYTHESSHDGYTAGQLKDKGNLASVSYAMGATTLGLQMGKFNDKSVGEADEAKTLTVGAYHALSKRTQAYVAYHDGKLPNATAGNLKVLTMGLNHSF